MWRWSQTTDVGGSHRDKLYAILISVMLRTKCTFQNYSTSNITGYSYYHPHLLPLIGTTLLQCLDGDYVAVPVDMVVLVRVCGLEWSTSRDTSNCAFPPPPPLFFLLILFYVIPFPTSDTVPKKLLELLQDNHVKPGLSGWFRAVGRVTGLRRHSKHPLIRSVVPKITRSGDRVWAEPIVTVRSVLV